MTSRHGTSGFTLVEVMVAVAIVGIIGAVAVPTWSQYVSRSWRAEAKSALQMAALWMERNQAATFRYDADPSGATIGNGTLAKLGWGQTPPAGTARYEIAFGAGPTAGSFVIAATPKGAQADADAQCGGPLAIDHVGQRGVLKGSTVVVDAKSEACWQR